ncbi:hypothetical protein M3Y97_00288400 [Aphelenchoides bicaudatus]|nr:hypothetical protein M3Y97_00288400 [Aphelenchoides bicaudatus]
MDIVPSSTSSDSVLSLCERLRSERLLVQNEHETLRQLNETIERDLNNLSEKVWTSRHEQFVLQKLINSDPNVTADNCSRILFSLNAAQFVPGHRVVGHHFSNISELFRLLIKSPKAVAEVLNAVDQLSSKDQLSFTCEDMCRLSFNVLFGSCVFPLDERKVLDLLANLISLQLTSKADPRKILRKGSNAFSKLYAMFSEINFSAKIFLTAALHEPIMLLLSQDELFLDIDGSKSPIRLSAEDRRRRFGPDEESRQYKERMASYRRGIVEKLTLITSHFPIHQAMSCFPTSLIWLIRQLKTGISDKNVSVEEAELICTDLLFTKFICTAITNPEPHGIISDTPISYIARFNLMQVGQILQSLALMPYEDPPSYMQEVLSKINQNTMPQLLRTVLGSDVLSLDTMFPPILVDESGRELYARSTCFGSVAEIQCLLDCLRSNVIESISDEALRKTIKVLIRKLPEDFSSSYGTPNEDSVSTPKASIPRSSSGRLRTFVGRVHSAAKTQQQRIISNLPSSLNNSTDFLDKSDPSSPVSTNMPANIEVPKVLIFSLTDGHVPLGLEPEEKITNAARPVHSRKHTTSDSLNEKKTRFKTTESVVSDHTDVASVASDEEEEASICSSLNDNGIDNAEDNLSDTVPISANVSGRGSPSLSGGRNSGRGTPFSGGAAEPSVSTISTTAEAPGATPHESHRNLPKLPVTIRRQNPEGLEEKFGKFGLPPQDPSNYRDETYSLVSDSWSTDVVASDNEGLTDQQQQVTPPIPPRLDQPHPLPSLQQQLTPPLVHPPLHESLSAGRINDFAGPSAGFPHSPAFALSSIERERMAENILEKYRTIPPITAPNSLLNGLRNNESVAGSSKVEVDNESNAPYYDPANITQCKAFLDAKRKLRLVLSSAANIPTNPTNAHSANSSINMDNNSNQSNTGDQKNNLNEFLKLLLAESINSQEKTLSAQIREVQRCLAVFDQKGIRKLLRTLKDEHRRRTSYLLYLQQSRLTLLQLNSYLNKLFGRVNREKNLAGECLQEMLVRFFFERKERFLRKFVYDFRRTRAQDERTYLVDRALNELQDQVAVEPIWQCFTEDNLDYVRKSMEHIDVCRDDVFHKSLKNLSVYITLDHPELRISKKFYGEAPWPSAQSEISIINAYKSPRDKAACVIRCCETIENLLSLASERSVSADDITPVLVYVLLQANPPALLSNIQYMDAFYVSRMQGEEAYWFTQFRASVEFLKQLCHKHLSPGN